jgi:DNA integrity scanning protein DisA with diadenylate cyclase activity
VVRRRTFDFSGIGLIVCDWPDRLPIVPVSETRYESNSSDLVSRLVEIASRSSDHHDGFHIITSAGNLTRVAQYFSPPIVPDAQIDRSKRFGGRYLAALFGSAIPDVIASGIASEGFGIAVFHSGKEVIFEDVK